MGSPVFDQKEYMRGWRQRNRAKIKEYNKKYNSKPAIKARNVERTYQWRKANKAKVRAQENRLRQEEKVYLAGRPRPEACEICAGKKRGMMWDHCHVRGHFRGWICGRCNSVLGFVEDDPKLLLKLAAYLKRSHKSTSPQLALSGV